MLDKAGQIEKVNILDVFEHTMNQDDPRVNLLTNDYFRLSQESKYLTFFEKVFELNDNQAYIDLGGEADKDKIIKIIERQSEGLDKIDKLILLNQVDVMNDVNNYIYKIENINILKSFVKGFLREKIWNSLYFSSHPMLLIANYDLSLPIIVDNTQDKTIYEKMATENDLFFR